MFLTTKGRYAVMAMVELATNAADKPITVSLVSSAQKIDTTYLEQIFACLKEKSLVKAFRGPGGGYKLAKTSEEITIFDIMSAVDEKFRITRCGSKKQPCILGNKKCATHNLWAAFEKNIAKFLSSISLEDVCSGKITNKGLML